MPEIKGASIVITGASSGIGRAAALAFAREGARLTLAARRAHVLEQVAEECRRLGGEAQIAPTDMTDPEQAKALAQRALETYGTIDVWVNNAGSGVVGAFTETPIEMHRRTIELNVLGYMYGAHAALQEFKRRGRGVLINTISMGGWLPIPYGSAYAASKFALRGWAASIRQELAPHREIHVCGVFPALVDTPGIEHGANQTGKKLNFGPLVYTPEDVARTMVRLVRHPRAEVAVGWPARVAEAAYGIFPRLTEIASGFAMRNALSKAKPALKTEGALLAPSELGQSARGNWLRSTGLPPRGR